MFEQLELWRNLNIRHVKKDPIVKSRIREVVDAKKIFCLIAFYEVKGFRYVKVGKFLNMNHATIVHHVKSAKDLLNYDPYFRENYKLVENNFFMENQEVLITDIESEINILLFKLNKLKDKREEFLNKKEEQKKLAHFETEDIVITETLTQEKKPLLWTN